MSLLFYLITALRMIIVIALNYTHYWMQLWISYLLMTSIATTRQLTRTS